MLAAKQLPHQEKIINPNLFNNLLEKPWCIIGPSHEQVFYYYDSIVELIGNEEMLCDGIGLSFESSSRYAPGTPIQIGFPLPESVHRCRAQVISSRERNGIYQTGIWLTIESDFDLLAILKSCDYLNIRHAF